MSEMVQISAKDLKCLRKHLNAIHSILGIEVCLLGSSGSAIGSVPAPGQAKLSKAARVAKYSHMIDLGQRPRKAEVVKNCKS